MHFIVTRWHLLYSFKINVANCKCNEFLRADYKFIEKYKHVEVMEWKQTVALNRVIIV
jgi:hypothetical protein